MTAQRVGLSVILWCTLLGTATVRCSTSVRTTSDSADCPYGYYGTWCDYRCYCSGPCDRWSGSCSSDSTTRDMTTDYTSSQRIQTSINDCPYGYYGPGCYNRCPYYCSGSCDKYTGLCNTDSSTYQTTDTTNHECPYGYYGSGCNYRCYCNGPCDRWSGSCLTDSTTDSNTYRTTDTTNHECPYGYYGSGCNYRCYCNGPCDRWSGSCLTDSTTDSNTYQTTDTTNHECPYGYYGSGCNYRCYYCNGPCDRWSGSCLTDSTTDSNTYQRTDTTNYECPYGYYGSGCNYRCYCNGPCDRWSGSCLTDSSTETNTYQRTDTTSYGCPYGYYGPWCDYRCYCSGPCDRWSGSCSTVETTTSAAEVTTSHGHHDITCTESRMEFSIPLSSPHTSETATLSDPNCQINVTRTHVRGGVDLNSCGTTVQFQNDSVIFRNAIIFSAPESSSLGSSGSNGSVSQYQDIIPIQCVYNRIATVHLSYMPVVRRVLFTESGVGQFSFNIQQFWDASFTNMVSDGAYPLRMELDADVFIQLSVGSEGQPVAGHKEIGMEVQQCLVSPSSSVIEAQLHYYPLIQDGCPASSDVHIIPNTNASDSTVMRFRFRAVNFFDPSSSSSSSLVFVHCRMGLCLTGSCKPSAWSCLTPPARRVRRDVDQSKRAAHQLSTGPFLIMADEASTSSSSTTATVMAVVSTSVATVAIVIAAIALIALRRRRTTARN